jgi:hypothetical protein
MKCARTAAIEDYFQSRLGHGGPNQTSAANGPNPRLPQSRPKRRPFKRTSRACATCWRAPV